MSSFVTHLESALDGTRYKAVTLQTTHRDRPLLVRYDLDAIREAVRKEDFLKRPPSLWRYRELLPVEDEAEVVSFSEGMTPVVPCPRLGAQFGIDDLWIKDESQMPTGTFKSRGMALAVTMAKALGVERLAIPTAGNAGGALAAYAARAGMETFVFMPADAPEINRYEAALAGAHVYLVDGLITDCGQIVQQGKETMGWFDVSTLKEPYRVEGKKTMGLELAEQFEWTLPDVVIYPTGGGTGLIGMWKAFTELLELGWIEADELPRMVAAQSDGCCPIVRAFEAGERFAEPFENPATIAHGLRVPSAVGDFLILDALRESGGRAVAVEEDRIREWMQQAASATGVSVGPEGAVCVGAAEKLAAQGWIAPDEHVVLFNCGAAQKAPAAMARELPRLEIGEAIDWERFVRVNGPLTPSEIDG